MELQGKVIAVLPEKSGVSARGEWRLASYVIETQEQYPKKLAFDVFGGDRIVNFGIQLGEVIDVSFDIDAHEYGGRYFNQIRAWNVKRVQPNGQQGGYQQPPQNGCQQGGQQWGANNAQAGAQAAAQAQQQAMRSAVPNGQPAPPNAQGDSSDLPF